jgi:hypothetical protein
MPIKYGGGDGYPNFSVDIDERNLPSRREALTQISKPVTGVHRRAKLIPPDTIAQALSNEPFEDYPRLVYASERIREEGGGAKDRFDNSSRQAMEGFLRRTFNSLTFIPNISFDIWNVSEQKERKAMDEAIESYHAASMRGQVRPLEDSYIGLQALRKVFRNASRENGFSIETIVSSRYLPELLVAAPVWFVEPRIVDRSKQEGSNSPIVRYFCDLGPSDRFAYLFQIYNHVPCFFEELKGNEIMPLPIAQVVAQVRGLFDYLVIATPYHDLGSREWRDERWIRNIDPFLFGFLKQVPEFMFFIGRWSGAGLFPLICDMIGDTIEHIRKNRNLLVNFRSPIWYREDNDGLWGRTRGPRLRPSEEYIVGSDHTLVAFANKVLQQFGKGNLFSWLRGERR